MLKGDAPIRSKSEDKLGRAKFAEQIAKSIQEAQKDEGFVVAIDGEWGDGKTSVLNMVEECLGESKIPVLHYDPWYFNTIEELILNFLQTLRSVLKQIGLEEADYLEKLKTLGRAVQPFLPKVTVGPAEWDLSQLIGDESPREAKKTILSLLGSGEMTVVVIVDDLDRLTGQEALAVFKMVKLLGNIPGLVFLLAFDRNKVANRLFESDLSEGEGYIGKIVQVALSLPPPKTDVLRRIALKMLEEIMETHEIEWTDEHTRLLREYWNGGVVLLLTTLRKAKKWANAIDFSIPLVKGEVNPADFVALETVRVFCPAEYKHIRSFKQELTYLGGNGHPGDEYMNALNKWKDKHDAKLKVILETVFPKYKEADQVQTVIWGNSGEELRKAKRAWSSDYFDRYFRYDTDEALSDVELVNLLNEVNQLSQEQAFARLAETLDEMQKRGIVTELLRALRENIDKLAGEAKGALALLLLGRYSENWFSSTRTMERLSPESDSALDLAAKCLNALEVTSATDMLVNFARTQEKLDKAVKTLWPMVDGWLSDKVTAVDKDAVKAMLDERIDNEYVNASNDITRDYPDYGTWILKFRKDEGKVKPYVLKMARTSQRFLLALASHVAGEMHSFDPLDREPKYMPHLEYLDGLVTPEELNELLTSVDVSKVTDNKQRFGVEAIRRHIAKQSDKSSIEDGV